MAQTESSRSAFTLPLFSSDSFSSDRSRLKHGEPIPDHNFLISRLKTYKLWNIIPHNFTLFAVFDPNHKNKLIYFHDYDGKLETLNPTFLNDQIKATHTIFWITELPNKNHTNMIKKALETIRRGPLAKESVVFIVEQHFVNYTLDQDELRKRKNVMEKAGLVYCDVTMSKELPGHIVWRGISAERINLMELYRSPGVCEPWLQQKLKYIFNLMNNLNKKSAFYGSDPPDFSQIRENLSSIAPGKIYPTLEKITNFLLAYELPPTHTYAEDFSFRPDIIETKTSVNIPTEKNDLFKKKPAWTDEIYPKQHIIKLDSPWYDARNGITYEWLLRNNKSKKWMGEYYIPVTLSARGKGDNDQIIPIYTPYYFKASFIKDYRGKPFIPKL